MYYTNYQFESQSEMKGNEKCVSFKMLLHFHIPFSTSKLISFVSSHFHFQVLEARLRVSDVPTLKNLQSSSIFSLKSLFI